MKIDGALNCCRVPGNIFREKSAQRHSPADHGGGGALSVIFGHFCLASSTCTVFSSQNASSYRCKYTAVPGFRVHMPFLWKGRKAFCFVPFRLFSLVYLLYFTSLYFIFLCFVLFCCFCDLCGLVFLFGLVWFGFIICFFIVCSCVLFAFFRLLFFNYNQ